MNVGVALRRELTWAARASIFKTEGKKCQEMLKVMRLALWEARRAAAVKNYDDAARFYMTLFNDLTVEERQKYLTEFVTVLEEMASSNGGDYSKQLMLLLQSRRMFPHEAAILNASAKFFFVVGRLLEAFDFAQEAFSDSKGQPRIHALVNLENIKSNIMDQWHWAMLNDHKRNTAYATAIQMVANWKPEGRVLDIGTGTGLLTSIARRYFEGDVYCCEADPNMCDIAEKVLKQAVIRKHSSEVIIDDVGGEEIDIVITETMDCGLLGEGIACSVHDVYTRILSSSPIVIPQKATVYACVLECPSVMDEHVTVFGGRRFVSESVTASYDEDDGEDELEPYWCTTAAEIRGGYKILSETIEIFTIRFDSRLDLNRIVNDGTTELKMAPIIQDGTAHCIMAWFSCELFPGAPRVETGPETDGCWQQAIYPLPKSVHLRRGGICSLKVMAHKDHLLCALRDIVAPERFRNGENSGPSCSSSRTNNSSDGRSISSAIEENVAGQSNNGGTEGGGDSVLPSKRTRRDNANPRSMITSYKAYAALNEITVLSNSDFMLMNDKELVDFFKRCLAGVQGKEELLHDVYVLDITNLAALSMALVNANPEMQFGCYNNDAPKLVHLFSPHVHNFGAFPDNADYAMTDGSSTFDGYPMLSWKPPQTYFEDAGCADVLLCWPVSSHGFLIETTLNRLLSFRLSNKRAEIIPSKISLKGQVVNCPKIVQRSKPCPSAYQDVDLSVINDLAISFYYDIEPSVLKHEVFSEPFELLSFRLDKPMPPKPTEMPEFVCLTEVPSETTIIADGTADGLLFWFDLEHGEQLYSPRSDNTLSRCALYLFDQCRKVTKGDKLAFKSSNYHGNLAFEISKESSGN